MKTCLLCPRLPCGRSMQGFACLLLIACLIPVYGCGARSRPAYQVDQYLLSYDIPTLETSGPINESLQMNRFTAVSATNSTQMLFRPSPDRVDAFNYSRWAAYPADMTADMLLRDLRTNRLFLAVFSRHESDGGRFLLQGSVDRFYLDAAAPEKKAVIELTITLRDLRKKKTPERILFQKTYTETEKLPAQSPEGFAQAMSVAMKRLSDAVMKDLYVRAHTAVLTGEDP